MEDLLSLPEEGDRADSPPSNLTWNLSQLRGLQTGMHLINELDPAADEDEDADEEFEPDTESNGLPEREHSMKDIVSPKERFSKFLDQVESNDLFMWCRECSKSKPIMPLYDELRDHFIEFHAPGWRKRTFDLNIARDFMDKINSSVISRHGVSYDTSPPSEPSLNQCDKKQPHSRCWESHASYSQNIIEIPTQAQEEPRWELPWSPIPKEETDWSCVGTDWIQENWRPSDDPMPPEALIVTANNCKLGEVLRGGRDEIGYHYCLNIPELLSIISGATISPLETLSKTIEWRTLAKLRRKFKSGQFHFRGQASNGSAALKEFAERCPKPEDLLNEGIMTYRDILEGHPPKTLQGVFAFVSLSFAMNAVMNAQGRHSSFSPSEADFGVWRESIEDNKERRLFDEITGALWLQTPIADLRDKSHIIEDEGIQVGDSMEVTVESIMDEMNGYYDLDFTIFDPWDSFLTDHPLRHIEDRAAPPGVGNQDLMMSPRKPPDKDPPDPGPTLSLSETSLFCLVTEFLKEIYAGGGQLLQSLCPGGNGNRAQSAFRSRSTTEITAFYRFVESARSKILTPLLMNQGLQPMHLAVSICSSLLQSGWLASVEAIEECTLAVAKAVSGLLGAEREFQDLVAELLHHSSTATSEDAAALKLDHRAGCTYGKDSHKEHDMALSREDSLRPLEDIFSRSVSEKRDLTALDSPSISCHSQPSLGTGNCRPSSRTPDSSLKSSISTPPTTASFRTCDAPGCDKRYNGPDASTNLRRHKREKHGLGKSFSCSFPECPFATTRRHNLKTHWRRRHKEAEMPNVFC